MSGHTPGPWSLDDSRPNCAGLWIIDENSNVALIVEKVRDKTTDANARLIAAAPDLLAALKRASTDDSMGFGNCPSCGAIAAREQAHEPDCYIAAAIAKAEGKP